jgi:microcystin-dependent protein
MSEPFISEIRLWACSFAPRDFANCDGQLIPISQNTALFSLIGTIYGGDGQTTFALPDLRGRVPVHLGHGPGLSPYQQGSRAGAETRTLNVTNIPPHTHSGQINPKGSTSTADQTSPQGNYPAVSGSRGNETALYNATGDVEMGGAPFQTGPTGSGMPFDIRQPYLTVRFTIAMVGVFPSRS